MEESKKANIIENIQVVKKQTMTNPKNSNHICNNHSYNTEDGEQAMCEELEDI